ncbi:sugar isomerase domain-containing protein [Cohnella zeiphila]|uniref:SIS domain-containing protein n=1 Tax=Cohnella zeiphila TaxID=2761120 RepID=A0A7X0SGK7_9BACL|nr:SIS domain-containing protein [Cohnella zeiphila]MBB6729605.1 SIS domain-containing protein [Cohnella zeiphila]
MTNSFIDEITDRIRIVEQAEKPAIETAAGWIAESISNDGLLHLFGCGHSHILVEDFFYRAGGLVQVNAILETSVMLHEGAVKSSNIERMEHYAGHIIDNYTVKPGEVLIVISNSGLNGLPVDMALEAKKRGLKVIALTSSAYFEMESRHSSGLKLRDVADLVIDNHLPQGDALVPVPLSDARMSSGSTIIGGVLLQMLMIEVAAKLAERGIIPSVYTSGNVPGGPERNEQYIRQYRGRIKHL